MNSARNLPRRFASRDIHHYSPPPTPPRGIVVVIFYTCWYCRSWSVSDGKVGLAWVAANFVFSSTPIKSGLIDRQILQRQSKCHLCHFLFSPVICWLFVQSRVNQNAQVVLIPNVRVAIIPAVLRVSVKGHYCAKNLHIFTDIEARLLFPYYKYVRLAANFV